MSPFVVPPPFVVYLLGTQPEIECIYTLPLSMLVMMHDVSEVSAMCLKLLHINTSQRADIDSGQVHGSSVLTPDTLSLGVLGRNIYLVEVHSKRTRARTCQHQSLFLLYRPSSLLLSGYIGALYL